MNVTQPKGFANFSKTPIPNDTLASLSKSMMKKDGHDGDAPNTVRSRKELAPLFSDEISVKLDYIDSKKEKAKHQRAAYFQAQSEYIHNKFIEPIEERRANHVINITQHNNEYKLDMILKN